MEKLVMRSTNLIELKGMRDKLSGEYPVDATVTADLLTQAGVAVSGGDNLPVTYYDGEGKDAVYYGSVPSTVTLTENALYIVRVEATWNDGTEDIVRTFDIDCKAVRR